MVLWLVSLRSEIELDHEPKVKDCLRIAYWLHHKDRQNTSTNWNQMYLLSARTWESWCRKYKNVEIKILRFCWIGKTSSYMYSWSRFGADGLDQEPMITSQGMKASRTQNAAFGLTYDDLWATRQFSPRIVIVILLTIHLVHTYPL